MAASGTTTISQTTTPGIYTEKKNKVLSNIDFDRNLCRFGCPPNSHCEWGFCECDVGFVKTYVGYC